MYRNFLRILYVSLDFFQIFKKIANIFYDFLKISLIFKVKIWILPKNHYLLLRNMGLVDPKIKKFCTLNCPPGSTGPRELMLNGLMGHLDPVPF